MFVAILNDDDEEPEEQFFASLSTMDSHVVLGLSMATVNIAVDPADGEIVSLYLGCFEYISI